MSSFLARKTVNYYLGCDYEDIEEVFMKGKKKRDGNIVE